MPWANDPESRRRSDRNYGATYRRNRDEAMRRARWRCEIRTPGICIGAASECDHIVSVAEGGSHGLPNLRAACAPCHRARTTQQGNSGHRAGRADPDPQPRTQW